MATCLPTPSSSLVTLSSPSLVTRPVPSTCVTRNGTKLLLDGEQFRAVGPNIYWLGLDENVVPNPSWPSRSRVGEIIAVASAMGANTIRAHTLGISTGTPKSVQPSFNTFNQEAFEAIDWAVWVAKSYGIRLVIPLTDQYDYYHGSIYSFLRFRNLSASSPSDFGPFYDTSSSTFGDFKQYISTLLTHRSNITGLTLAEEPTVLAFETGNELGGWGGSAYPPPIAWTTAIAQYLKEIAPNTLVISGTYGVREEELKIEAVDIYSDHYYPPYSYNLKKSSSLACSHNKAFFAGEFDWGDRYYQPLIYLAVLVPVLFAAIPWLMPGRWWPWRLSLGCFCCRGRKRRRRERERKPDYETVPVAAPPAQPWSTFDKGSVSSLQTTTLSSLPTYPPVPIDTSFANTPLTSATSPPTKPSILDRSFPLPRWGFSLLILLLAPILAGIISVFLPTPLKSFLSAIESSSTSGSFYWSLFGRDDACCSYVQHNDGYTLHYPSDPALGNGNAERAMLLTRHAWRMQGGTVPSWMSAAGVSGLDKLTKEMMPVVSCPQGNLALPVNSTWTGGT